MGLIWKFVKKRKALNYKCKINIYSYRKHFYFSHIRENVGVEMYQRADELTINGSILEYANLHNPKRLRLGIRTLHILLSSS